MKELLKSPLIIVITFFILLFLYSTLGPRLPISIITQQKGEPLIVTEEGSSTAIPDIAKVTLGIEENGTSLRSVQESVNKKSKSLVSELKKLGIDEKDIKTSSYNIYPKYNYDSEPPKISGYRVSINYEVTIDNFDKVNEVLVKATEVGANSIGNVSFDLKDKTKEKALDEARDIAIEKAKSKAKSLAKAANISLGRILNISESQDNSISPRPIYAKEEIGLDQAIAQPEITPGETKITVNISISWEIK
ncbi:SIMPL domain-containing protein [Patescibacteria group bacterium]|nr:SIMPL domain-containing protein [Patescibacteria group bacterium]